MESDRSSFTLWYDVGGVGHPERLALWNALTSGGVKVENLGIGRVSRRIPKEKDSRIGGGRLLCVRLLFSSSRIAVRMSYAGFHSAAPC